MGKIYLALDYGYEGWNFTEYDSVQEAIKDVLDGNTHGCAWKILKELDVEVAGAKLDIATGDPDVRGWIGVDLDGTLAHYEGWQGPDHVGEPVPAMLERVKLWVQMGTRVKIFTARCYDPAQIPPVKAWLEKHGLGGLEVTNVKDFKMLSLWDDRCIQVIPNTGEAVGGEPDV